MKIIVYLDQAREIGTYLKYRSARPGETHLCVAGDAEVMERLKAEGLTCVPIAKYQNPIQLSENEKLSRVMADSWFLESDGSDATRLEKISLGQSLKAIVSLFLNHTLKAIDAIYGLLDGEKPDSIVIVESPPEKSHTILTANLDMYKVVFRWLAREKKIRVLSLSGKTDRKASALAFWRDLEWVPLPFVSGKIPAKLPGFLVEKLKTVFILAADGLKNLYCALSRREPAGVRALVLGASDISYLGGKLLDRFLSAPHRVLYYLEHEMNCYPNANLRNAKTNALNKSAMTSSAQNFLANRDNILARLKASASSNPLFEYRGIPLFDLCEKFFKEIFSVEIPELLSFYAKTQTTLDALKINIVLITNNLLPKPIILSQSAIQRRIPALHVPHGHNYGLFRDGQKFINPFFNIQYYPKFFSHEAVGLKINRQLMVESGMPAEMLLPAGIPECEIETGDLAAMRGAARIQLGFGEKENILLLPTHLINNFYEKILVPIQLSSFENLSIYETLVALFAKRPQSRLVFKFRPGDILIQTARNLISRSGASNVSVFLGGLDTLLRACDAVLVNQSNVGLEALYHDVPVIQFLFPGKPCTLPLDAEGAAIGIRDLSELPTVLDRLEGKTYREERIAAQRKFLKDNLPDDNLTAAERIVQIIDRLADSQI